MQVWKAEPFSLEDVLAVIEVYEVLHGKEDAPAKIRQWAAPKRFTESAYRLIIEYIELH